MHVTFWVYLAEERFLKTSSSDHPFPEIQGKWFYAKSSWVSKSRVEFVMTNGMLVFYGLIVTLLICVWSPLQRFVRQFAVLSSKRLQGQGIFSILVFVILAFPLRNMEAVDGLQLVIIPGFFFLLYLYLFRIRVHINRHISESKTQQSDNFRIAFLPLLLFHIVYLKFKIDSWHRNFEG